MVVSFPPSGRTSRVAQQLSASRSTSCSVCARGNDLCGTRWSIGPSNSLCPQIHAATSCADRRTMLPITQTVCFSCAMVRPMTTTSAVPIAYRHMYPLSDDAAGIAAMLIERYMPAAARI